MSCQPGSQPVSQTGQNKVQDTAGQERRKWSHREHGRPYAGFLDLAPLRLSHIAVLQPTHVFVKLLALVPTTIVSAESVVRAVPRPGDAAPPAFAHATALPFVKSEQGTKSDKVGYYKGGESCFSKEQL